MCAELQKAAWATMLQSEIGQSYLRRFLDFDSPISLVACSDYTIDYFFTVAQELFLARICKKYWLQY